jgi:hypothetical protein
MSNVIELPSCGGHHFGSFNRLKPFIGCYFEEIKPATNIIKKAVITKIEYKPDEIYSSTDGHAGKCWTAHVKYSTDEEVEVIYNFRNIRDLVMHYEKKGFKFV